MQGTQYKPEHATFRPLVNGEEAFGAVFDAIMAAKHSVDIICWGFQPSMYFKRGSSDAVPIGQLLEAKGKQGVKIRLLVWCDDLRVAQFSENMMPGSNVASAIGSDTRNSAQREFDHLWYWRANLNNVTRLSTLQSLNPATVAMRPPMATTRRTTTCNRWHQRDLRIRPTRLRNPLPSPRNW